MAKKKKKGLLGLLQLGYVGLLFLILVGLVSVSFYVLIVAGIYYALHMAGLFESFDWYMAIAGGLIIYLLRMLFK